MIDDSPARHWVEAQILNDWHHSPGAEWKNYDEFAWNYSREAAISFLAGLPEGAVVHILVRP